MASLYIKDFETNALAERLADRRGLTKTAAVKLALVHELERDAGKPVVQPSVREVMDRHWQHFPPPPADAPVVDKSFYDWLSDE